MKTMANRTIDRRQFLQGLAIVGAGAATAGMVGCSTGSGDSSSESSSGESTDKPVVKIAYEPSGMLLNAIAQEKGYLDDAGVQTEFVTVSALDASVFPLLETGQVDLFTNWGTNLPLEAIAAGQPVTIVGGYMLEGCMPIIAKKGAEWNGVESMVGKTIWGEGISYFALTGPLLDMGYDPENDCNFVANDDCEARIAAVKSGEADYAFLPTGYTYQMENDPEIDIVAFTDDVTPEYSCCRVEGNTQWLADNRDTMKSLLKAWIRAQEFYENNKEEAAQILAEDLSVDYDYTAAFVTSDHFTVNVDPYKKNVLRAWDWLGRLGIFSEAYETIDIDSHIDTSIYKEALDEAMDEYYEDDPDFYDKQQEIYEEQDAIYE